MSGGPEPTYMSMFDRIYGPVNNKAHKSERSQHRVAIRCGGRVTKFAGLFIFAA